MEIKKFKITDIEEVVTLFYDTVHSVNAIDYSQLQLDAWASKEDRDFIVENWLISLTKNITFVAKFENTVVGFVDLTDQGHLDRLYVHKDFQRMGIASALIGVIESEAMKMKLTEIHTEASLTAQPFFEHKGYHTISSQTVQRKGVDLPNFRMMKTLK